MAKAFAIARGLAFSLARSLTTRSGEDTGSLPTNALVIDSNTPVVIGSDENIVVE